MPTARDSFVPGRDKSASPVRDPLRSFRILTADPTPPNRVMRGLAGISTAARQFEFKPLLILATVALLAFGFAMLADAVMEGDTRRFDTWLLMALREPNDLADPLGPKWFEEVVRDITALGSTIVLTFAVAVTAIYLWINGSPQKAAFLVAAVSLGALLNRLLKLGFARPRPDIVAHGAYVSTESFPSGHSANSAIIYLMLGMMLARVEASYPVKVYIFCVGVLLTFAVGMSRIYLGVHWPTDVLAGWAAGACWVLVCWYVLLWLQPSGTRR
jgi:undecaprenyl-diphosphatase